METSKVHKRTDFKDGDRVLIAREDAYTNDGMKQYTGKEGTVEWIGQINVHVRPDGAERGYWWSPGALEHVKKEKVKFKEGDRVRIEKEDSIYTRMMGDVVGKEGVIRYVDTLLGECRVKIDGQGSQWWYKDDSLTLIDVEEAKPNIDTKIQSASDKLDALMQSLLADSKSAATDRIDSIGPNLISAEIIADSINATGDRITTYVLKFPRIVLAEFNTHRAFSRNSASSRAIPFAKMLQLVKDEPFFPIAFQKEHKGMQGTEYLTDPEQIRNAKKAWDNGRVGAMRHAEALTNAKVTKQLANRMLETYMYHTVICTATDYENFFALRAHPDAEIHIADLAQKMLDAYNASDPVYKDQGQYHIPFGDKIDDTRLKECWKELNPDTEDTPTFAELDQLKAKIAMARCARVSYLNFEGKDDYMSDIKLANQLIASGHMSPAEHPAYAVEGNLADEYIGNFKGWMQYRKTIAGENRTDSRVIKKS